MGSTVVVIDIDELYVDLMMLKGWTTEQIDEMPAIYLLKMWHRYKEMVESGQAGGITL